MLLNAKVSLGVEWMLSGGYLWRQSVKSGNIINKKEKVWK